MSGKRGSPGRRLLIFLMDGGGSRTILEISRRNNDGRLLAKARPELDGLIVEETGRSARTKRPVKRIALTLKGWAVALALRPDWEPQRLATPILKAWLTDLQREQDSWACQFLKDAHDAAELARLKANGWIRRPTKGWIERRATKVRAAGKIGSYRGYEPPSEYVQERDCLSSLNREPKRKMRPRGRPFPRRDEGKILSPASVASPPVGSTSWRPELSRPPEPAVPRPVAQALNDYEQYIRDVYPTQQVRSQEPRLDSRKEILDRAKRLGYPIRHEVGHPYEVMHESRWTSADEWNRLVPEK